MIVNIEKLDDFGRGITFINNKICFIENALKDEVVEIEIIKEKRKYIEAKVIDILVKSKKRIENECPYYLVCGGCCLRHLNYLDENTFKKEKITNLLKKFTKIDSDKVEEIIYNKDIYYRNKIILHGKNNKLGLYQKESNDIIEIDNCLLANKKINEIIALLQKINYNIDKVIIKTSNDLKYSMVKVDGKIKDLNSLNNLVDVLILNNQIITKKHSILTTIGNIKYKQSIDSFFQVNRFLTKELYDEVLKEIKKLKPRKVLDLYCGTGSIGIYISKYCQEVVGIDYNHSNIKDANINKEINKLKNIKFIADKVENRIQFFKDYTTVIVDPPRAGLDKKTKEYLIKFKPKNIFYISCDPVTLMRDLNDLSYIFKIKYIKPFNMFPRTYHVECVCVLEINKKI